MIFFNNDRTLPNFYKNTNKHNKDAEQTLSMLKTKRSTSRNILVQLKKTKDKENLESSKRKMT